MPSAVDRFLAEARSNVSRRSVHVDTGANNVLINPVPCMGLNTRGALYM